MGKPDQSRRRVLGALLTLAALPAWAGPRGEEELSAAVRASLQHAVADDGDHHTAFSDPLHAEAWLSAMAAKLARYMPDEAARLRFLTTVSWESARAGLDPQLVLALIQVESRFRKYAVSPVGAMGYMQVMPFWLRAIGQPGQDLFQLRTNLRYGCTILRYYIDQERGNLFRALGRYNGSLGQPGYPVMVVNAWKRNWSYLPPTQEAALR